jgi:O-antigen ligase
MLALPVVVAATLRGVPPSARVYRLLLVLTGALATLALSAALSENPLVALGGKLESRTGWAMWAVGLVWFWLASTFDETPSMKRLTVTVSLMGVAAVAAAVVDAFGLVDNALGWSDKPAGVFENALSLAQFLVLALGCAVAWLMSATSRRERVVAAASGIACGGGILLSGSRGALVGAVAGALLVVAIAGGRWASLRMRRAAAIVFAAGAIAFLAVSVFSVAAPEQAVAVLIDNALTDRPTLWRASLRDFAASPLLGQGPGMFSSFARWGLSGEGSLSVQWANDPHSTLLYMLAGGGVLGFLAAGAGFVMLGARLAAVGRRSARASAVVAGLFGWFASTLFTWVNPLTLLAASLLAGVLVRADDAAGDSPATSQRVLVVSGVAACVLLIATAVIVLPSAYDEFRWALVREADGTSQYTVVWDAASRSYDPTYAMWLLNVGIPREVSAGRMQPGTGASTAGELLRRFDRDIEWFPPLALASVENVFRARAAGVAGVDQVEQAVARARRSDPGSGCFDFVAADRFASLGLERRALAHARSALQHELSPEVRTKLERFAAHRW